MLYFSKKTCIYFNYNNYEKIQDKIIKIQEEIIKIQEEIRSKIGME